MRQPPIRRPYGRAGLERAALHYLDRYASSADNLRRVLARKALARQEERRDLAPETAAMIEDVVAATIRSGLVDDARFADMKVASLLRRGASPRAVRQRLRQKGVDDATAASALAEAEPDEAALARRHAERRRLGPFRTTPDPERRDRDLASLMRAGFSLAAARAALADEAPEAG